MPTNEEARSEMRASVEGEIQRICLLNGVVGKSFKVVVRTGNLTRVYVRAIVIETPSEGASIAD